MTTAEAPAHEMQFEEGYESFDTENLSLEVGQSMVFRFRQWDTWEVQDRSTNTTKEIRIVILQEWGKDVYFHSGAYDLVRGFTALQLKPGAVVKITRLAGKDTGAPSEMKCYRIQPAKAL